MIESSVRVRDDLVADTECRFWHVDDWGPRHVLPAVAHPVQRWHQGQGAVDIQGFWPADYDVAWAA